MGEKDYFLKLTLAVYRVSEYFPEDEPLKNLIREKSSQVLAELVLLRSNPGLIGEERERVFDQFLNNTEILLNYFDLAQKQNWVDPLNFLILKKEYNIIKGYFQPENEPKNNPGNPGQIGQIGQVGQVGQKVGQEIGQNGSLNDRCQVILNFLKENDKVQPQDFKKLFPQISKRTLRRDFKYLLEKQFIQRIGDKNTTFYTLRGRTS